MIHVMKSKDLNFLSTFRGEYHSPLRISGNAYVGPIERKCKIFYVNEVHLNRSGKPARQLQIRHDACDYFELVDFVNKKFYVSADNKVFHDFHYDHHTCRLHVYGEINLPESSNLDSVNIDIDGEVWRDLFSRKLQYKGKEGLLISLYFNPLELINKIIRGFKTCDVYIDN